MTDFGEMSRRELRQTRDTLKRQGSELIAAYRADGNPRHVQNAAGVKDRLDEVKTLLGPVTDDDRMTDELFARIEAQGGW